jgi:hypothetical protein
MRQSLQIVDAERTVSDPVYAVVWNENATGPGTENETKLDWECDRERDATRDT